MTSPLLALGSVLLQTVSPSPSPGAESGGFPTGPSLIVLAVLVAGLLLMRSRLLRR